MKKNLVLIGICVVVFSIVAYKTLQVPVTPVHYHANFAVFIDGTLVNFSKPDLMHIKPCTNDESESSDPAENVHLHDQIGNVVHLHADGITWKFFLSTIHFDLDKQVQGKSLSVYSKGMKVDPEILSQQIKKRDEVLIHISSESAAQKVADDPILMKENESVGTSAALYDEGKVGVEKCGVVGDRTLYQRFKLAFGL